jgi:Leucine-rich repeat (LRR) protein
MWENLKKTKLLVCVFAILNIVATQNVCGMDPEYEIKQNVLLIYRTDLTTKDMEQILLKIIGANQIANVQILDLADRKLKRLPSSIDRLDSLEYLYLNNNNLSDSAIEVLKGLTKLKVLDLRGNNLMRLPYELGTLTQLSHLLLEDNKITMIPPEIRQIQGLTISPKSLVKKMLRDRIPQKPSVMIFISTGAGFAIGLVLEFVIYRALTTNRDYWCGPYYTG